MPCRSGSPQGVFSAAPGRSRRLLSLRPRDRRRYDNANSSRDCDDRHHRGPAAVLHGRLLFLTFHASVPRLRTSRRQLILERYTNRPRVRKRARWPAGTMALADRYKPTSMMMPRRWRRHRPHCRIDPGLRPCWRGVLPRLRHRTRQQDCPNGVGNDGQRRALQRTRRTRGVNDRAGIRRDVNGWEITGLRKPGRPSRRQRPDWPSLDRPR
jgi:hypothetical protein